MNSKKEVQHVYLVGAKSLGAYGGYETFVYKLTEYHQNKENIKYHVACKANGDGCMDESKFEGVTKINDHEFEFHNAHCFKICNELFTWADVYDTANHDERRAILQQFIKEIRVRKDYEISITLNASFNQVEQLKAVSTYDGAEIFEEISEKGA